MPSPRPWSEIRFRLRQEFSNLRVFAFAPRLSEGAIEQTQSPCSFLPDPENVASQLKTTGFAPECIRVAEEILVHRFPLLGVGVETGDEIRWRKDYASGLETRAVYFRRIPYLDAAKSGDHKTIWEINRHQHLVLLAQAHLLSGRRDFLDEIVRQLHSWFEQNLFQRGINWSSALEVALRTLSWIWVHHLVGGRFDRAFRRQFLDGLYHHGLHLEANLSLYFSPNTHLLGETVALHALGKLFPHFPRASRWEQTGAHMVAAELDRQVREDGSHFEQSSYYRVYALDMFLFHAILSPPSEAFRNKLTRMAVFLDTLLGPSRILPFLGDDDGGRFFHPYGARNRFGLATLATCGILLNRRDWSGEPHHLWEQAAWWLGPPGHAERAEMSPAVSAQFPDSGLVVMAADGVQLIADAGPFGPGNAGHSHSDTLSLLLRRNDEQILIDPGTFTYTSDPVWRARFRGTAAHNTVRIDERDQAIPSAPFAWKSPPEVDVTRWASSAESDFLSAVCSYAGFRHWRTIVFSKTLGLIVVLDRVEGPPGEHRIEQFWHFGVAVEQCSPHCFRAGAGTLVALDPSSKPRLTEGGDFGWVSPAFGLKTPAPVVCAELRASFPAPLTTVFDLSGRTRTLRFRLHSDHSGIDCFRDDASAVSLVWNEAGVLTIAPRPG